MRAKSPRFNKIVHKEVQITFFVRENVHDLVELHVERSQIIFLQAKMSKIL